MPKENIEDIIKFIVAGINKRCAKDPEFKRDVGGLTDVVQFTLKDTNDKYAIMAKKGRFKTIDANLRFVESKGIKIVLTSETFIELISGELKPVIAMSKRKIKVTNASAKKITFWLKILSGYNDKTANIMSDYRSGKHSI